MIKNIFLSSAKKSLGALIMIISLILQPGIPATAAETADETAYLNNVALLEKLGIITDEDGMQYTEEYVSRENFAQMLGVFYGISRSQTTNTEGEGMFEDVSKKSSNCALIEAVASFGAMDGYKDRKFRPSANLTVEQAAKAMVVLLGYKPMLSVSGDGLSNYVKKAHELDLLDGVKTANSKAIKKSELVKMLCTALDTEILQPRSGGYEKKYEKVKNETLLSEKLGIYKIDGILQATEITALGNADVCNDDYILADGYEIYTEEDMNDYLGMHLYIYCTGDDFEELEMIYFFGKEKKNKVLNISVDDIENADENAVSYVLNGKTKRVRLPQNVTVIYNGKNNPLYTNETFEIKEGSIRLLDAEADGKYETVFIKSYISFRVGQVYDDEGKLSIIDAHDSSNKYVIDTEDVNKTAVFKKKNTVTSYSDIKNNSVVSIAADKMELETKKILSDASYYEVLISDATVTGVLENASSGDAEITIDGVLYEMNHDFDLVSYDIEVGDSAKFYIDVFGKVIAAEKGSGNLYGILERVFEDDSEDCISGFRIFASDGAFKMFECANKLTIDGKKYDYSEKSRIKTALKAGADKFFLETAVSRTGATSHFQLIKYLANSDGRIIMIDTVVPNSTDPEIEKNYLSFKDTLKDIDKNGSINYFSKAYATTIEGGYIYDSNVIIFRMPNDKSVKDGFAKKNGLGTLGYEKLEIPVYLFDVNEYNYVPVMIAESDTVDAVPQKEDNNMMIFEKLSSEISENGEICDVMNGTSIKTGTSIKAYMDEVGYKQFQNLGIQPGDIVRWSADEVNIVTNIEHLVKNIGNESAITVGNSATGGYATGYYSDFRITCGTVEKFDEKFIMFNLGTRQEASLRNPSAKVLVYNSDTCKTEPGDYSAIKTKEAFGAEASLVFTYQWFTAINTIVIFN